MKILYGALIVFNLFSMNSFSQESIDLFSILQANDVDKLARLLDQGFDANAKDVDGLSLLFHAVSSDNVYAAKILLNFGANVNDFDPDGDSLLQCSKSCGMCKILVENGAHLNEVSKSGLTALGSTSQVDIAKCLIELGANVNFQQEGGLSPLVSSIYHGVPMVSLLLLSHGADPNILPDAPYHGALQLAVGKYRNELMLKLLEAGADPNLLDNAGESALILSCVKKNQEQARILLEHGADANLPNEKGEIPLLMAVKLNDLSMIELLLNWGAVPCKKGSIGGRTGVDAYELSRMLENEGIERLLTEHCYSLRKKP